jgi:hypothetical protein
MVDSVKVKELRVDAGAQLRPPTVTAQGFLRVEALVGRPGIYEYINTPEDEKKGFGKAGSTRRELREDSEVFSDVALDSFEGAPATALHPKKMVDVENVRSVERGTVVSKGWRVDTADGPRVAAAIVIKDARTMERVRRRELSEASPGYDVEVEISKGTHPKYGRYDAIQRKIEINHLALVPRARGGGDLQVRLDAADVVARSETRCDSMWFGEPSSPGQVKLTTSENGHQHSIDTSRSSSGETSWAVPEGSDGGHTHAWVKAVNGTVTIAEVGGHTHAVLEDRFEVPDGAVVAAEGRTDAAPLPRGAITMDTEEQIRSLKQQLAEATKVAEQRRDALDQATTRADRAEGQVTTLAADVADLTSRIAAGATAAETEAIREQAQRADAAESKVLMFEERLDAAAQERADLIVDARTVMGDTFNHRAMSNRDIKAILVKRLDSKAEVGESVSDATLTGRLESLLDVHRRSARSLTRAETTITGNRREVRTDAADGETTREGRQSAWRNQWKHPLPNSQRPDRKGA